MAVSSLGSPFANALSDQHPNLAIIGAGVVGLCTALEAQRQGFCVTLLDAHEPGLGASFGNAGYLATEVIDPLATPETVKNAVKLWLNPDGPICIPWKYFPTAAPWYAQFLKNASLSKAEHNRRAISLLNRASQSAWQRTLSDIGAESSLIQAGNLVVWEDSTKRLEARQLLDKMTFNGIPCEFVEGERLAELEPELSKSLSHAVYCPDIYRLSDPYQVCQQLFQAFKQRGGHFINERVMSLQAGSQHIELHIPKYTQAYGQVIICSGAWSKTLLEQVGLNVPLEAERGYHLTYPEQQTRIQHTILSADRRFVMSPLNSGLRVVGMSEIGGTELPAIPKRFQVLRKHTHALLPELAQQVEKMKLTPSEWMGHRPTLPDSLPVIDQHPHFPRLAFAFGHQHLGVTQAAITAELIIAKLKKRPTAIPLNAYRVDRF